MQSSNVESQEVGCLGSCMLDTGCMCENGPSRFQFLGAFSSTLSNATKYRKHAVDSR